MTIGSTPITATATGSWQAIYGSGMSNASGNLVVTLTLSAGSVYWDDFKVGTVNPASPTASWGQTFGFDGFGNLLPQTPIAGSTAPSPSMTLSANATIRSRAAARRTMLRVT